MPLHIDPIKRQRLLQQAVVDERLGDIVLNAKGARILALSRQKKTFLGG